MGKTNTSNVLKNILKDVSNVRSIIDDLAKLEGDFASIDLKNAEEVESVIEAVKVIVDNLKLEATKVHDYFDTNYQTWKSSPQAPDVGETHINNNNESDPLVANTENDSHNQVEDSTVTNDNCAENDTELSEKSNDSKNDIDATNEQPKGFLKCVDINKLINPDILPLLVSPKPLQTTDAEDTVLIISDSEEERNPKTSRKSHNKNKLTPRTKNLANNKSITDNSSKKKKVSTVSNCVTSSASTRRTLRKTARSQKKYKEVSSNSEISSNSDSDNSVTSSQQTVRTARSSQKNNKNSKLDIVDKVTDPKFSYKAYVPIPRIQCEKLKEHYLQQKEINEVDRLTNLKSLKKRFRLVSNSNSDSSANSDKERTKKKRQRKESKSSSGPEIDLAKDDDEVVSISDVDICNGTNKDTETEDILNTIISRTESDKEEKPADEEEKETDSKTDEDKSDNDKDETPKDNSSSPKKDEKDDNVSDNHSEDEKKEDSDDSVQKKKKNPRWRKDKLLTAKLTDTDTEDELEKFKKDSEKGKSEIKARLKKKSKKVISSDSEYDAKKSSSDDDDSEKKSSSSSSEEEKQQKKKRTRIKRVDDSSDDNADDDLDKSTRRTIRKVIGHESLAESTKRAEKDEQERKLRILERQKKYNQIFDCDKPADATIDKLVLDFNEQTKKEILSVNKDLVKSLKPHQGKGVQFMWDACFESVERAVTTDGSGCILAHCMGLGKTLQVIALTHTILTNSKTKVSKILVVCPLNTVLNWSAEYKRWLDEIEPEIDVYELVSCKQNHREFVVEDWHKNGGVLIVGYDMFRNLTNPNNKRLKKRTKDILNSGFVNPGPDLVVCDEGHLLKNEKTNISIAMNRIRTARRIVLTGTPMQNNLKEYYCMVQFVKPNLLGTYKEYINRFVNPITNGQYTDSTTHDINVMRKRSHVLHKLLDGIVQRKDYSVLTPFLPPKYEYVVFLLLTETQIKMYQHYKTNFSQRPVDDKVKSSYLFADFQEFQRICTHPRVLLNKSIKDRDKYVSDEEESDEGSLKDFIDDDESEAKSTSSSSSNSDSDASVKSAPPKKKPHKRLTRTAAAASGIDINEIVADQKESGCNEWWREYCDGEELDNIELSSKLYLLFQILQECELIGDKLLVFSQSLYSLSIIEYFLAKIDEATQQGDHSKVCGFSGSWSLGLDYFRLDGSSSCDNRAAWCKNFNNVDNPRARLFLISTRAGGLGINLVGANRVIIFDVSWNPSHDTQSIYRVYRFGQTKPCYIYRFVIWGAMEMKIYERQVTKQAISKRVIDEQQIDRHYNQNDLAELYNFDPRPEEQITPLVPKDVLLAELLHKEKDRIYKYHEHQTLLENKEDEELDEAERKAAWEEFEIEKTRVNTSGWIRNLPIGSVHMAVCNIVQTDHPTWTKDQVRRLAPLIIQQLKQQVEAGNMELFDRVAGKIKQIQEQQQAQFQFFVRQQQEQQQFNMLENLRHQFLAQRGLGQPNNPNEIVELND